MLEEPDLLLPGEEIAGELLWKRLSVQSSPVALCQHCLWAIAFSLFLVGSLSEPAVTEQEDGQWHGTSECSVSHGPVSSPISSSFPSFFLLCRVSGFPVKCLEIWNEEVGKVKVFLRGCATELRSETQDCLSGASFFWNMENSGALSIGMSNSLVECCLSQLLPSHFSEDKHTG